MGPTDEELDRDWQPNGRRPQSTIARSFSQELMDIFKIENSIADLDEQVDRRKQQVTTQTSELESLEARIKEMEERLKRSTAPGRQGAAAAAGGASPRAQRQALNDAYGQRAAAAAADEEAAAAKTSRPGTAKPTQQAPAHGGAMPPTPTASEGEYELDNHRQYHHQHHRDVPSSSSSTTIVDTITPAPPAPASDAGRSPGNFADYVFVSKDGGDRDT